MIEGISSITELDVDLCHDSHSIMPLVDALGLRWEKRQTLSRVAEMVEMGYALISFHGIVQLKCVTYATVPVAEAMFWLAEGTQRIEMEVLGRSYAVRSSGG